MTITPAAKAGTVNILVAAATAIASGNAAVRVHPNQENLRAAARGNSGIDPAAGHRLPVTIAWKARTGDVR